LYRNVWRAWDLAVLEGLHAFQILSEMFRGYMISNYVLNFISTFSSELHENRSSSPKYNFSLGPGMPYTVL